MKKTLLAIVMMFTLVTAPQIIYAENYNCPAVHINGKLFEFAGLKPIVRNGRILVPLKSGVFDELGAKVQYDIINKESIIRTKNVIITNYMDELDWYNSGIRCYISDVRSDYINGDAYISIRAAMESLGKEVSYDDNLYAAYIE